jgi:NAD(P)-dependent dehydrogenase (short-subunit alcohol dehydrogenase family)
MASAPSSLSSSACPAPFALVTGAASGIGLALADALLARGIEVVAIDRDTSAIDARAQRFDVDVRDADAMARVAQQFAGRPASHVFANAGIGGVTGDVLGLADDAWQWAFDVNVLGAIRTLRLWWPQLRAGRGKAVATVSSAALQSFPGAGPYRATKAALLAALEGLHYESRGSGVSVHALCPGLVRTGIADLGRYPEAGALMPPPGTPPSAFAVHVAQAMRHAESAPAFAERVLQGLDAGAPFYWQTHPETAGWMRARHHAIEQALPPFSDFGAPA